MHEVPEAGCSPASPTPPSGASASIGDYAIIGDCRSAALVSRSGSVDWLCLPRFDGESIFAAILDEQRGGRFSVRPAEPHTCSRRYLPDTNVLETTFVTTSGRLVLRDAFTVAGERTRSGSLTPDHEFLRQLECIAGEIDVEVVFDPRPGYGRARARVVRMDALGLAFDHGATAFALRSDLPVEAWQRVGGAGIARLRAGQRAYLSLTTEHAKPPILLPLSGAADARMRETISFWQDWMTHCSYDGPYRELVHRSALALKLLAYPPSGAIVAAATTSLPETPGGERNWDYRYCWLRDASHTVRALLDIGFTEEAEAFLSWLLHATRLTRPELKVLYDVYGRTNMEERTLDHLSGFRDSRPVRIGNAARDQFQLDVYGEVITAAHEFVQRGGELDAAEGHLLSDLTGTICRQWRRPDYGIWEIRAEPQHHTHSKAMCWVGIDRVLDLARRGSLRLNVPEQRLRDERDAIRAAIEQHAYDPELGSYVAVFGSKVMDATLLLMGVNGFEDPGSDRMRQTLECVRARLGANGLLRRYDYADGLTGVEGTFGICSFWEAELFALRNEPAQARREFEEVCRHANDVGLFAEQIDPATGEPLGNFPQAFTHIGLISAAAEIGRAEGRAPELRAKPPRTTRAKRDEKGALTGHEHEERQRTRVRT